jgi:hypothetical protein
MVQSNKPDSAMENTAKPDSLTLPQIRKLLDELQSEVAFRGQSSRKWRHRPQDASLTRRRFLDRLLMGLGALSVTNLIRTGIQETPAVKSAAATVLCSCGWLEARDWVDELRKNGIRFNDGPMMTYIAGCRCHEMRGLPTPATAS